MEERNAAIDWIRKHAPRSGTSQKPSSTAGLGYRGFLSAVWMFYKMNRKAHKTGVVTKCELFTRIPWFR